MRLVWHMARKDIRRMALPVLPWLAFIVATAVWFRSVSPAAGNAPVPETVGWLAVMRIWTRVLVVGQAVIGYLLVGALVLEDPLTGPEQFWMTRPIANARLFAAKLVAATLLFILVPTMALVLVWLASGFTLSEAWLSAGEFVFWQSLMVLPALAVASLARTLAQFLFCTVALIVGCLVVGFLVALLGSGNFMIPPFALPVVAGLALVQQFITRRTARTWLTVGVALPVCIAISRRDRASGFTVSTVPSMSASPAYPEVKMTVERPSLRIYAAGGGRNMPIQSNLTLTMSPATRADGSYYAPAGGMSEVSWPGGSTVQIPFQHVAGWGNAAARHWVLGTSAQTMGWSLHGVADGTVASPPGEAQISGWLEVWLTKPQTLGELALQLGSGFSKGASRTRVIAIESSPGWEATMVIEERDSQPSAFGETLFRNMTPLMRIEGRADVFVLVNRAANRAEIVSYNELGSVAMQGQVVGFRRLYVPLAKAGEEWRRKAMIVKVRLEREEKFLRSFETRASMITSGR